MTTYTMLIEKGKREGKAEVVINLFDGGFETARIAKFVKMLEEDVTNILKNNCGQFHCIVHDYMLV